MTVLSLHSAGDGEAEIEEFEADQPYALIVLSLEIWKVPGPCQVDLH